MLKMRVMSACAAAIGAMLLLAGPALADMKAFNEAVKAGNYKVASAEAKTTWQTWDKSDRDTAIVAREFGFAAYVAGDFAAAKEYGQFLKDNGATLATPDDQPEVSKVLLAVANYRLDANVGTRQALFEALKAREPRPGLDMQSVLASEALYRGDWGTGNWGAAVESAALADRLMGRGGDQLLARALDARATSAVAGFMGGRDKEDYAKIVQAHNDVVGAIDVALNPRHKASLIPLKFRLEAWAISVEAVFKASQQTGSLISKDVKTLELRQLQNAPFDDMQAGPDPCMGDMDISQLRYPQSASFRGMVGTVIMRYTSDAEGRITKPEILAAVPVAQFAESVEKAASTFRLKRAKEDSKTCSLAGTSRLLRISFYIL